MKSITYRVEVNESGVRYWYINSQLHREDGPACEYANGDRHWYQNDKLHRTDGPAIEHADGYKSWYINNEYLTEEEFLERTQLAKELTVAEIEKLLGHKVKVVK